MRYLLDTNIFLWWLDDDRRLKGAIRSVLGDPNNQIFVSVVSAWEISIKHKAGKLPLKTTVKRCFEVSTFEVLNINLSHIVRLDTLPIHHKDPFDRLLVAQSKGENLTFITTDEKIWKYNLSFLKA